MPIGGGDACAHTHFRTAHPPNHAILHGGGNVSKGQVEFSQVRGEGVPRCQPIQRYETIPHMIP